MTVGLMGRYAAEDSSHPAVVRDAQGIKALDDIGTVKNAWAFVRGRMRFQPDQKTIPGATEVLIRPADMSQMDQTGGIRTGDCDDFSMWLCSVLYAAGVPANFATAAAERDHENFSHVYVVAYPLGQDGVRVRVPVDASHGQYPGWECPAKRRAEWNIWGGLAGYEGLNLFESIGGIWQ